MKDSTKGRLLLLIMLLISLIAKSQWEVVLDIPNCTLTSVHAKNDSTVFVTAVCGNTAKIYMSENFGENWNIVHEESQTFFYDVEFPSSDVGYVSAYSNVLKTVDGGLNWFYPNPDFEGYPYQSIAFENDSIGFGCFADGGSVFAKTTNGGLDWYENNSFGGRKLLRTGDCRYAMLSGQITNTNNCWESHSSIGLGSMEVSAVDFSISTSGHLITCGLGFDQDNWTNYGYIGVSHNNGDSWTYQDFPQYQQFHGVAHVSDDIIYVVGAPVSNGSSSFIKSIDGGENWFGQQYELPCSSCESPDIRDVACSGLNNCYAIYAFGSVYRTLNGGGELTGIVDSDINDQPSVALYPNPGNGVLNVEAAKIVHSLRVFNSVGQLQITVNERSSIQYLDLSELDKGLYFIQVEGENWVSTLTYIHH